MSDGTDADVLGAGGAETCAPHTVHLPVAASTVCAARVPHTPHLWFAPSPASTHAVSYTHLSAAAR